MKIRNFFLSAAALLMMVPAVAQTVWHNPLTEGEEPYVQGRAWNSEIGQTYHRFPDRAKDMVREAVWNLSLCSSGLLVDFFTNADKIVIRYNVKGNKNADNIPKVAKSGIDIYRIDKDGVQHWVSLFGHYNFGKTNSDQIVWTFDRLSPSDPKFGDEYKVYLPMYSEVENLEIGIPEGKVFRFAQNRKERPIVVYGTSIAMGASPSRNGNAWTNMLERRLDTPVINLAFSGNGRLEPEVLELLAEIDARAYILDCTPNLTHAKDIEPRLLEAVRILRAKRDCPILIVEHSGNVGVDASDAKGAFREANVQVRSAFKTLKKQGWKKIYYMSHKELGLPMDGMVEGVHPNDLGMRYIANGYEKKLRAMGIRKEKTN